MTTSKKIETARRNADAMLRGLERQVDTSKPTAHTPGPWIWERDYDRIIYVLGTGVHYGTTVCRALGEADARLIAASPDLLAALKRAEHLAKNVPVFSNLLPSMRAAIAKAENRQA